MNQTESQKPKVPFISRKQFSIATVLLLFVTVPLFLYSWKLDGTHYPFRSISRRIKGFLDFDKYSIDAINLLTGTFLGVLIIYCILVYLRGNDIAARRGYFEVLVLFTGTILALSYDRSATAGVVFFHVITLAFCMFKKGALSDGVKPLVVFANKADKES